MMNTRWTARIAIALLMFVGTSLTDAEAQVCDGPIDPSVPVFANGQAVVVGTTVTLSWNLGRGTSALLCLRTGAGGLLFEGVLGTVNTVSGSLPPGTYGFRVFGVLRGQLAAVTQTHNFTVGGGPTVGVPGPPDAPTFTRNGLQVTLNWVAPLSGGAVSDYLVEIGSASGASDLLIVTTVAPTLSGTAAPGIYYVRTRARNAAGTGPPSPELIVDVPAGATPAPPGPWQSCSEAVPSIVSAVPVAIEFVNVSNQPRRLYWIDFAGTRQPYGVLQPGQSGFLTSFITHSWLITDLAGTCLGTLVISGSGRLPVP
jgi:hypothetical protein